MGIFNFRKKNKIDNTEFIHAPEEFIQFLKAEDEETVAFGRGTLVAAGKDAIGLMLRLLTNEQEDEKFRRRGGEVLTLIGVPAIKPLLVVLEGLSLDSESDNLTRAMVAGSLAQMGKPVVESLIQALNSPFRQVRFGVATAIIINTDPRAIDALRNACRHCDSRDLNIYQFLLKQIDG